MTCQRCGKRDASIHLIELVDGDRKSLWLCPICAGKDERTDGAADAAKGDGTSEPVDSESLASFLGQVFGPAEPAAEDAARTCTSCGYSLKQFGATNRLGCPRCYQSFRARLMPMLASFHRHVSHLGKAPRPDTGTANGPGEIARIRVALEKAIAAEDFEEAARLRDRIRQLESREEDA
jgi:protein arginine kinase activator